MKKIAAFFVMLLLATVSVSQGSLAAPMQQAASLHQALSQSPKPNGPLFPAAAEIGQQIQALVTGGDPVEIEPQETFGTRALGVLLSAIKIVQTQGIALVIDPSAVSQAVSWFNQQSNDSGLRDFWSQIGQNLLMVVLGSFIAGIIADFALIPLRRKVKRSRPVGQWGRFAALSGWFVLALVPVISFIGAALVLLDQSDPSKRVRFVVLTVVYALAVLRMIRLLVRLAMASHTPHLRLLPLSSSQALFIQKWLSAFSLVMVLGYYALDVARLVRVPAVAITTLSNLVGLVVVVMGIVVIVQGRSFISDLIRGDGKTAKTGGQAFGLGLRFALAKSWHVFAISYLVVGYIFTTLSSGGGFVRMQQGTILTIFVLLLMRFSFFLLAKIKNHPASSEAATVGIYRPVLKMLLSFGVWVLGGAGVLASWGFDVKAFASSAWGQRIIGSAFTITTTLMIVVFIYELIHTSIERKLNKLDAEGGSLETSQRAKTLLPMVRNAAIIVLAVVVGIVTLSELGVNIEPLLAGAGVIGVAVGFGSQTLVKDFLTGLFIILENTIAVGDIVAIGDNAGVVESITIRTVRLRDLDGALHVIPFSEMTRIINRSKGFSYALLDIGVAYDSDLRKVMDVMQRVGKEIETDPFLREDILEPIEMMGIEKLGDFSITVRARFKTRPGKQYNIQRVYNLLIKERFDKENIEIPFPTTIQIHKN